MRFHDFSYMSLFRIHSLLLCKLQGGYFRQANVGGFPFLNSSFSKFHLPVYVVNKVSKLVKQNNSISTSY